MKLKEGWYEDLRGFHQQRKVPADYQLILLENEDYVNAILLASKYGRSREESALKLIEREKEINSKSFNEYSTMWFISYLISYLSKGKRFNTKIAIRGEVLETFKEFLNLYPYQAILEKIQQNIYERFNPELKQMWDLENQLSSFFTEGGEEEAFAFGKECLLMPSGHFCNGWSDTRNPEVPFFWY
jgi:hypothetical protein